MSKRRSGSCAPASGKRRVAEPSRIPECVAWSSACVASVEGTESLDVLAKEARLSKYHFARCFQQATGVAPHRYRKLLRLLVAKRHLENGRSVNETALAAGFSDASHLSRAFREWLGVTPWVWGSAWRAANPFASARPQTIVPPGL